EHGRIHPAGPAPPRLAQHAEQLEATGAWVPGLQLSAVAPGTTTETAALVSARGLTVKPAPHANPVVTDIDLAISPGERFAVMGANGTGKTTLLMALAGLTDADGEITGQQPVLVVRKPQSQY